MTFQVEKWSEFLSEAKKIFPIHWEELGIDKDKIRLSMDFDRYQKMEESGIVHVVTVRDRGVLVGYYVAFILVHSHYKDAGLMAFTDFYFILPEFRAGGTGTKLLIAVEGSLKEKGVTKAYLSCKTHQDHTGLFEALGWKKTDYAFTKVL